jgi:hypothetical protein
MANAVVAVFSFVGVPATDGVLAVPGVSVIFLKSY